MMFFTFGTIVRGLAPSPATDPLITAKFLMNLLLQDHQVRQNLVHVLVAIMAHPLAAVRRRSS